MTATAWFADHNAGGPVLPEVLATFVEIEQRCPGNPASPHAAGRAARAVLEAARERIAQACGVAATEVLFTSGGTEAANLAVLGLGDPGLPVVLAPVEHPAVMEPARARGIVAWNVDAVGTAQLAAPGTPVGLCCLTQAQGELGTLQPVAAAAELAATLGVPLFVDAAQSLGRVPLAPVLASGAIVALSPHKAGGLRGHGVLLGRHLTQRLRPLLRGGSQELGLRPGTQSPALAAANALAIERALREQPARSASMTQARDALLAGLRSTGVLHQVLTPLATSLPNTVMLYFPGVDGRNLVPALDLAGIHASHGSACSSGAPTPPPILRAIGLADDAARACVRFSLGQGDGFDTSYAAGSRIGITIGMRQKKN
jgi:cysteine desulfurase